MAINGTFRIFVRHEGPLDNIFSGKIYYFNILLKKKTLVRRALSASGTGGH